MNKIKAEDIEKGILQYNEETMLDKFEEFLKYIEDGEYSKVPSMSAFADFINCKRSEMQRWTAEHKEASERMKELASDTIASGAMLKKYYSSSASLVLKNWCGWEEAPKKAQTSNEEKKEKTASQMLDEYIREKKDNQIPFPKKIKA